MCKHAQDVSPVGFVFPIGLNEEREREERKDGPHGVVDEVRVFEPRVVSKLHFGTGRVGCDDVVHEWIDCERGGLPSSGEDQPLNQDQYDERLDVRRVVS